MVIFIGFPTDKRMSHLTSSTPLPSFPGPQTLTHLYTRIHTHRHTSLIRAHRIPHLPSSSIFSATEREELRAFGCSLRQRGAAGASAGTQGGLGWAGLGWTSGTVLHCTALRRDVGAVQCSALRRDVVYNSRLYGSLLRAVMNCARFYSTELSLLVYGSARPG